MISIKHTKIRLVKAIFGCFFGILGLISPLFANVDTYAEPPVDENVTVVTGENEKIEEKPVENEPSKPARTCNDSLGSIGWLVCPTTGKISEAVDWLYDKNKEVLEINPLEMNDESPIYNIWQYFLGVANIVFVIFLLIVVYSQITGVGITNYGIKKALPKLIIAAIMVNLSFVICSMLVDASNIIGNGLRGIFSSIEESSVPLILSDEGYATAGYSTAMSELYMTLAGGAAITTVVGVIAFEGGEIWMLIPAALGALVAVAIGLITIAMRQAVVMLLVMISPMAIVSMILPNTEKWYTKWKDLFIKMLVFYPMYSLLFGASSLAGWAILSSAHDGFGVILGTAVKIFPLFFSWSLMKMSGTFLGTVNAKLTGIFVRPLATNRAWAESHREFTRQKLLASKDAYTPSLKLRQFLSDRKIAREEDTKEFSNTTRLRGLAYGVSQHYKKGEDDMVSKDGEMAYEMQARNMRYQKIIERDKNNMNKGLGTLAAVKNSGNYALQARLNALDDENIKASDELKMEMARGAKIDYDNAKGFMNRALNAEYAKQDLQAIKEGKAALHQFHGVLGDKQNLERLNTMKKIMEGSTLDTTYLSADAAHSFTAQAQIMKGKFGDLFSNTVATQDIVNMLNDLTKSSISNSYIDPIVAGLKTLNMRGDTNLVKDQINNILANKKVNVGTYASQSLANFLMFDVKDNDPALRRFGKYINMQTAKMFNEGDDRRTKKDISFHEYINGGYYDEDVSGNFIRNDKGERVWRSTADKASKVLLKGTSYKGMERTAIQTFNELLLENSVDIDEHGNKSFNFDLFLKNQRENWDAIMPNIISDQYSFLSGSEQITALGKGITGTDVRKHKFDWKGIFGSYAKDLTDDQKIKYIEFLNKRTRDFLGGQVPAQIAKTKTDMLESVRNLYTFTEAVKENPDLLKSDYKLSDEEYKKLESKHMPRIKENFVGSFKEDALDGFAKMYHKGYQGEAKAGLVELLDPEGWYEKRNLGNNKRSKQSRDDDDDDDGAPVNFNDNDDTGNAAYSQARINIEQEYNNYRRTSPEDIHGFWEKIKGEMNGSSSMFGRDADVEEFEQGLDAYTNVDQVFHDVIQKFFGGFNS